MRSGWVILTRLSVVGGCFPDRGLGEIFDDDFFAATFSDPRLPTPDSRETRSLTTSATFLSSLNPRNAGWRSLLSEVHSVKATWTTKRGRTQVATRSRGASLTVVAGTTSFESSSF